MIYYSSHYPPSSGGGVTGTSLVDLTATTFADIFALATDYNAASIYKKGDVVYNQSSLWVYINNTSGSGNAPPTLPGVSNSYWEFIGSKGTFTWIAYGNSVDDGITITDFTIGSYDSGGIVREFIGMAVNKTAATESTNPADYVWTKFVGKDGIDGIDGDDGIDGEDAISGYLTNEAVQLYSYANGGVVSYTPASGYFKVYSGPTNISGFFTLSTESNPQTLSVTYTGGLQYIVTGGLDDAEDTATLTIRATGSGPYSGVVLDKVFTISKSKGGYEIVSELPISNLFEGRIVYNTADEKIYRYNGSSWTAEVNTTDIVGKIQYTQLANGAVRAQHLLLASKSLNTDPSFEGGADLWSGFIERLPRSNPAVPAGCPSPYATRFSGRDNMRPDSIPVVPGEVYRASCWVNSDQATTKGGGLGVVGYVLDGAGASIAAFAWPGYSNASGWVFVSGVTTIPPNGAMLRIGAWADRATYSGNSWHADLNIEKVNDASLIVDGSITSNKVATDAITANKIQAGAVTAAKIAVTDLSTINANVGTLTAGVIRNSDDTFRVDVTNGRTITQVGTYMKVTGAPFGSTSQFIEWYGPYFANLTSCTEANAEYYLKTNGQAYFGGSISAGIIKNAAQSTNTAANASLTVGAFTTNGDTKTIVLSYGYSHSYFCATGTGSITGSHSIAVLLEKSTDGGSSWSTLLTLNPPETERLVLVDGEPGVPDRVVWAAGSTTTITDNSGATNNMMLRATIISRTLPTFGGTSKTDIVTLQNISIVSTE